MIDNIIELIAEALLRHQGYTDEQLAAIEPGHDGYGCQFCPNHQRWDCTDEDGRSLHPDWDAVVEASETANVVVEALGLEQLFTACMEDEGVVYQLAQRTALRPEVAADDVTRMPSRVEPFVGMSWRTRWWRFNG